MMDNGKPPQTSSSSSEHVNPSPSGVGLCDTCGIPTHQRKAFWKRDPFTNENVYQGICIQCHGESVPASVFWEWHSQKTKRSHSLLSSPTGAPWNSLHSFSTEDSSSKVKPHQKHPSQRQKDNKLSFAALTNIDTTVQQEDLEEKYWKLLKLFQSCRTDPTRPTPQELEQLPFSEEDWRSLVLIQTTDLGCRFLQLALVYRSPYPAIRFLLQKDVDSRWTVRHEDVHGSLPLHYACRYGASIDVFELLMREDQIYNKTIHHADKQGCLPLHVACRHASNNAIFKFLLDKDGEEKAILRRDENGYLPIHLALERNSALQTIELLVAADILKSTLHAPNPSGLTTISEIAMKYDYHALLGSNYVQLLDAVVEEMNIHTACRFGVPMESIELLLDMDSNQSVYKIDQDDNLPLHCALDGSASAEIIRHLIKVDTFKTTLHQKNKDGSTPLLKIVLREDSLSLLQGFPSLLQAAKDLDVVQEMNLSVKKKCEVSLELQIKHTKLISTIWQRREIESRPSVAELTGLGFTEEVWRRIVLIENDDTGWLPLQWALAFGAPPTTISFLLEKDFEHQSIYHPSLSGSLPIHFACLREFSFDVIQSLLEKDATRTTILEKNSSGKRPLDLLPKDSDVIANLVKDVQKLDAQPDTLDFFFESSPPELFQPAMLESMEPNKANVNSFEWLNHAYCQDLVIVFVMLEFYLLLAWLGIFIHSSILHVTDEEVPLALAILLQAMALLVLAIKLRRLFKTASLQSYFTDMYNLLGLGAIGLVVASSVMLSSNGTTFPDERALLMTTGAFQFALLIAFLKRMFHSIATFVGGVILICFALIPFAIVTGVILLAFAFLLFVNRYGTDMDEEHDTLWDSFGYAFATFVRTPGSTSNWLDITFATVSVIVLLNVAIAIVNQNWMTANSKASKDFWIDRLNTILELGRGGTRKFVPVDTCWNNLMGSHNEALKNGYSLSLMERMAYCLLYFATFLLGLLTFGFLWPLEMRRHLFAAPVESSKKKLEHELVASFERKIQMLEDSMEWNQRLLEGKIHDEFDELKSLIVSLQHMNHKASPRGNDGARVNWTGKPQPFPPNEIFVAQASLKSSFDSKEQTMF